MNSEGAALLCHRSYASDGEILVVAESAKSPGTNQQKNTFALGFDWYSVVLKMMMCKRLNVLCAIRYRADMVMLG